MIKGSVTAGSRAFADAVKWAAKFVAGRPSVPIQGGLLLDVEGEQLSIVGSNEAATARATVAVEGDGAGQVVVSGRLLAALAATFGDKPVVITGHADEPLITITVGSWRGTLPVMTQGDFPSPPPPPPIIGHLAGDGLAQVIAQAAAARTASDETQAAIYQCVHLTFTGAQVTALATNMYRAAMASAPFSGEDDAERTALVPGTPILEVAESLAGPDDIWIGLDDHAIGLASPTRAVIIRQLGEAYTVLEPVRRIFQAQLSEHARVAVADLQGPMRRARLVREKDGPIRVTFADGSITLSAAAEVLHQDSDEQVPAGYAGPEWSLKFNPGYFGDALASAPGPVVDIAMTTGKVAGVLLTVPGNEDWHHALMPIKK